MTIFIWVQVCSHSSDPRVSCVPGIVLPKSWVLDPSFSSLRTPATGTVGSISFDEAEIGVAQGTADGTENVGIGDADIAVSEGLSSYQGGSNTDLVRSESRERGDPKKGSSWASIVSESSYEDEKAGRAANTDLSSGIEEPATTVNQTRKSAGRIVDSIQTTSDHRSFLRSGYCRHQTLSVSTKALVPLLNPSMKVPKDK